MGSDVAMANCTTPTVARDAGGKKKRVNRSAKLKQCKLDARREQWLSQLKNKGSEVGDEHALLPSISSLPMTLSLIQKSDACLGRTNPELMPRKEVSDGKTCLLLGNDMESPIASPTHSVSGNNSSAKGFPESSMSSGSFSRSVSDFDEDEEDREVEGDGDGSQDDWEAVADALTANDCQSQQKSKPAIAFMESTNYLETPKNDGISKKPNPNRTVPRAWRPDDVFRPQSLPNLSKQHSLPLERSCIQDCENHRVTSQSSSCPICFEDLDLTDSSFLPCACGFHLCLFCHKQILETDGRCPGCRKQYSSMRDADAGAYGGGVPLLPLCLSRSCSMKTRY